MKRFYRVEKDGIGPYCANGESVVQHLTKKGILSGGCTPKGYDEARPLPRRDKKLSKVWTEFDEMIREQYIFGFSSVKALLNWFNLPEEIEFFQLQEYKIYVYKAVDTIKGSKQTIAKKEDLILVDSRAF